jgi:hypothetical protein
MPHSSTARSVDTGEQPVRLRRIADVDHAPTQPAARHGSNGRPSGGPLDQLEATADRWLIAHSLTLLRLSLGVVFLGFGVLKLVPGVSPAQNLVETTTNILTFGLVPGSVALVGVAALECTIGLCLIGGRAMRPAVYLLAIELIGILSPLVLLPSRMFSGPHHAPTLEGSVRPQGRHRRRSDARPRHDAARRKAHSPGSLRARDQPSLRAGCALSVFDSDFGCVVGSVFAGSILDVVLSRA